MVFALRENAPVTVGTGEDEHQVASHVRVEIKSRSGCPLIVDHEQRAAVEHFGILRARLLDARAKSGISSIVVTSPQRQDGKTFTSTNLAISLAQLQHERILLVDGDLRMRGITRGLALEQGTGLADFLQRKSPFQDCVKPTTLPHLYIAPAGNVLGDLLPGVLQGSRWPEFLEKAKQEFDLMVVDSVPVTAPIADFELLLSACDTALLVVHMRKTPRESLEFIAQRMHSKLLGVVVNNIERGIGLDYHSGYGTK